MDVSHIQRVLGSFTKSHVSVALKTNKFEESCSSTLVAPTSKFDLLDDMLVECRKRQTHGQKVVKEYTVQPQCCEIKSSPSTPTPASIKEEHNYVEQLFFILCCIKDPLLTLKPLDKTLSTRMQHDLLAFIDNTQVKTLDMAKYKYTKKSLREVLTKCITRCEQSQSIGMVFDFTVVRAVLVVAVRHLKKSIILQIQGQVKEHFQLPQSMKDDNEHNTIINYVDNKFIIV